ncbi:MAG: hypothetical protein WBF89_20805 [Steroidobacteraceae bacterium]
MDATRRLSRESGRSLLLSSERSGGSMSRSVCRVMVSVAGLAVLWMTATRPGALAGSAMAQAPDAGCALPSEPEGIPAALDAAISGPADKDRACMKALLIPEARMMFVSLGAGGAPTYTLKTLDDWIAGVKARGHAMLEEKQLKFHIERYGNIAHLWSSYAFRSDGKQVARGINSIQAIKEAGRWRVAGIMVQAESAAAPLPKEYLP